MKTYIIEYFSVNKNGVCIITEYDRRSAIKTFNSDIRCKGFKIKSINQIKSKLGILYFN